MLKRGESMKLLKCVNQVRIDGEWRNQSDMDPEEFSEIMEKIFERGMKNIGFERVKNNEHTAS